MVPTEAELYWFLAVLLVSWAAERIYRRMEADMERPETCITHNAPLILCDQCVQENAMRMRRRLEKAVQEIVARNVGVPGSGADTGAILEELRAELAKELP